LEQDRVSHRIVIARAKRFLHNIASGEIEELADFLAEAGFTDASRACAAIRANLLCVIDELRGQGEIEEVVALEALVRNFDETWGKW